jgi:hypothetical protein
MKRRCSWEMSLLLPLPLGETDAGARADLRPRTGIGARCTGSLSRLRERAGVRVTACQHPGFQSATRAARLRAGLRQLRSFVGLLRCSPLRPALRNSLRALRALHSNSRSENDDEARCARGPQRLRSSASSDAQSPQPCPQPCIMNCWRALRLALTPALSRTREREPNHARQMDPYVQLPIRHIFFREVLG